MKTLKYTSTLIAVADMEKSKQFYDAVGECDGGGLESKGRDPHRFR